MHEVIHMLQEPDCKAAHEIALREADRVLRQAHLCTVLRIQQETGHLDPADETAELQRETRASPHRERPSFYRSSIFILSICFLVRNFSRSAR